ncbi:MAG: hypothetical protein CFE45_11255 [Burkholderiales bacterium PBB5]|nr:MAG: hypothetical protein CFE45_11255 [Burkholderiales bacterium PBB5]
MSDLPPLSGPRTPTRLVAAVVVGLLLLVALVLYQLVNGHAKAQADAEQRSQHLALGLESYLLSHVRVADVVLGNAADDMAARLAKGPIDAEAFTRTLERQRSEMRVADALRATDADGNVRYGPGLTQGQTFNVADRAYFQAVRQGGQALVIGMPVKSRVTGQWMLPMARAVRSADGRFLGMVYAFTNTQRMLDVFSTITADSHGVVTLFDDQRRVLLRHPGTPEQDADQPRTLTAAPTLAAMAQGRTQATYRTQSSLDGIDRVISLRKLGEYPLYVIVGVARDDYLADWRREAAISVVLLAALCLSSLVLGLLLHRMWLRRESALHHLQRQEAALQDTVASLRLSEARFRALTDGLPQMVWTCRPDGSSEFFSHHWCAYTGLTPAEMLDPMQRLQVLHADDRPALVAAWSVATSTQSPYQVHCRIRRHDGQWRVFDSRAMPQRDAQGRVVGWVGSNTDITESQQAHEALLAAKRAADEANNAKSSFLAMMSHEMRTPLNGVMGFAHLGLRDAGAGSRSQQQFERILDSGRLLLNLINDLLDLSKIEAGKLTLELQPVALRPLLDSTVELLRQRARDKGIGLMLDIGTGLPEAMLADPLRLQQVLMNLLSNAVKFTEDGHVAVLVERQSDELVVVVEDTGIGMSDEQLGRLYQPFEQADSAITRRFGGTGLGLAITQRLVLLMGGRILVSSALGQGTRFELRLPWQLPPAAPAAISPPALLGGA